VVGVEHVVGARHEHVGQPPVERRPQTTRRS
jgi:hypothetical protein